MLNDDGSLLCHLIGWTADLLTEARRLQRELVECEDGREEEGKRCLARIQTCLLRFQEWERETGNHFTAARHGQHPGLQCRSQLLC